MLQVDLSGVYPFIPKRDLRQDGPVRAAFDTLLSGCGAGAEMTGWLRLPDTYDKGELERIQEAAEKIRQDSDVLIVIGIGGSYLGARAAIELLHSPNYNLMPKDTPDVFFVGNNLSGAYLNEIGSLVQNRNCSINVISKSGVTTEPAIAFRIFKRMMEEKYGNIGAKSRIYATTDQSKGALKEMADREGYAAFTVPDDIGGRYSVLTAVGLLPIAVSGIDAAAILTGAKAAMDIYLEEKSMKNPVWQYAAARQALYRQGKTVEILACYEPAFRFMAEWWKQLFGESEGKDGGGIFPASVELTADLHSMGQYIQDGTRNLMETIVSFEQFGRDLTVPAASDDADGLNYLAGKGLAYINSQAKEATKQAHIGGGVPNIEILLPQMDAHAFGELVYFFELACGVSGYMQGVNPFNQPGVEEYKKNMFRLLGKPGY